MFVPPLPKRNTNWLETDRFQSSQQMHNVPELPVAEPGVELPERSPVEIAPSSPVELE